MVSPLMSVSCLREGVPGSPCCLSFSGVLVVKFLLRATHTAVRMTYPTGPLSHTVRAQMPPFCVRK